MDRLLALLLELRYRQVVTLKRMYRIVVVFWVVSTAGATLLFWSERIIAWYDCIKISLCVVTAIFSYAKMFLALRHNRVEAQGQVTRGHQGQNVQFNTVRYKKAVSSVLWVKLGLVVCYLPFVIVEVLCLQSGVTSDIFVAWFYSATLILLNSSLNPILYCWKIRKVRQAVKDTIRGHFCSTS